jgi:hypothetical protein|nr:MAG TPA: hypothetical protein [Caudoviricetes sp.]
MKQSNISKIAALRKCLNRFAYTKEGALIHAKDYLGNGLKFESEDVVNDRGHAAIMFTVYDENDEYRRFSAEICADKEEFHFKAIELAESVYRSNARLAAAISNKSRIKSKQAWILNYYHDNGGFYEVLVSYSTVIAAWKVNTNVIYLQRNARNYSNTTRRHLSDFEAHVGRVLGVSNKTAVLKWACFEG